MYPPLVIFLNKGGQSKIKTTKKVNKQIKRGVGESNEKTKGRNTG
jgi:hypothetical protein